MPDPAERLRALHQTPPILVLPNAWDAASARVFEAEGFPAIATTSAGVSAALGYPDGGIVPSREMIEAVARIVRAVTVPVTADIEHAYAATSDAVAEVVLRVIAAGEALLEGGLPEGVVNVVLGQATGEAIVSHPLIRKIALTGSTPTGKKVMARASPGLSAPSLRPRPPGPSSEGRPFSPQAPIACSFPACAIGTRSPLSFEESAVQSTSWLWTARLRLRISRRSASLA